MDVTKSVVRCACLWLLMGHVRGSHIPAEMNRTIQNLTQYYRLPLKERFNGKSIFSKDNLPENAEIKKVYMGGVLEIYDKLISKMLEQLPTPSPETSNDTDPDSSDAVRVKQLKYILKMVHKLKNSHYRDHKKLLQSLDSLHKIKTEDTVVQSKALWELPWLYEEASALVNNRRRRRRRRTLRNKKRAAKQ